MSAAANSPSPTSPPPPPTQMADLAAAALLGADRSGKGRGDKAAADLLRQAAIAGTRRRAGYRPTTAPAAFVTPCPDDPTPIVNSACDATLRMLLGDPDAALLTEWMLLAASHNRRVPDGMAPALLDWCLRQTTTIPGIEAVLGTRLDWLCNLNPEWRTARLRKVGAPLTADTEFTWQTAPTAERAALLTTIRRTQPARAEALLRTTWSEDGADDRAKFVARLQDNLSAADEPFLEWSLDDRSKQVRTAATSLLARLPASQFVTRMLDRAAAMMRVESTKKGLLRRASDSIVIEPPNDWDKSWERDGLEEKPPGGIGKRAWWMRQVLTITPPQALADKLHIPREQLLKSIADSEYAAQAILGLSAAAATSRDEWWCAELISHLGNDKSPNIEQIEQLWKCLPPAARETQLIKLLKNVKLDWSECCTMIGNADHRWSRDFSLTVCRHFSAERPGKPQDAWAAVSAFDRISRSIDPDTLADFDKMVHSAFSKNPQPSAIRSIDRVRQRADMHKEFTS